MGERFNTALRPGPRLLEKPMAAHSSTLAWKILWTEEPGRLQSMGLQRIRYDWATSLSLSCIGEGNGNPLQCSCLENPRDRGAWWVAVYGVAKSQTRLKWLSKAIGWPWWGLLALHDTVLTLFPWSPITHWPKTREQAGRPRGEGKHLIYLLPHSPPDDHHPTDCWLNQVPNGLSLTVGCLWEGSIVVLANGWAGPVAW